jgi:hypothetical protein
VIKERENNMEKLFEEKEGNVAKACVKAYQETITEESDN